MRPCKQMVSRELVHQRAAKLTPVTAWGHVDRLAKYRSKIALIAKSDLLAQVRNRHVRRCQQPLRLGDSQVVKIGGFR